jgi:hypothetical protein
MSRENTSGLDVLNIYGPRPVPDMARGVMKTEGGFNEMTFELSGKDINDNLSNVLNTIPAGVRFQEFYVEVQEVFADGTTLHIGTSGSEATNGFDIALTGVLDTVGISTVSTTLDGTWALTLAAETEVGIAATGTFTNVGHARIVARYLKV